MYESPENVGKVLLPLYSIVQNNKRNKCEKISYHKSNSLLNLRTCHKCMVYLSDKSNENINQVTCKITLYKIIIPSEQFFP